MEQSIIQTEYSELMQKSYIDYAMSVIISRALPDVRDGLKPVQRHERHAARGLRPRRRADDRGPRRAAGHARRDGAAR